MKSDENLAQQEINSKSSNSKNERIEERKTNSLK